jgi:3-hydroxyisobutyrate dehydrogenase-like beta-hydroxyacid dehydrogenase
LKAEPASARVRERFTGLQLEVAPDIPSLVSACDIVLSVVTPAVAGAVAREAADAAGDGSGVFVDFNSTSPAEKQRLAEGFREGKYVDGAILGSIAAQRARAPLALSGPAAETAAGWLDASGFDAAVVGSAVGAASALKMCRSIFMKGVECLFLETVLAAEQFGIRQAVLASIEQTFSSLGFEGTADMLLTTHAVHCGRRASEMEGVMAMLAAACLPNLMSAASRDILKVSAAAGLPEYVHGRIPPAPEVVTSYLSQFYRERCS